LTHAVLRIGKPDDHLDLWEVYGAQSATMSCRLARSLYSRLGPWTQSSMLLLTGTERVSRASWAHSASCHLSAASMHSSEVKPQNGIRVLPTRGWSGRIRTVQASIVHLLLALPLSPLQGSSPRHPTAEGSPIVGERPAAVAPQSTQYRQDRAMHITGTCTVWHPAHRIASQRPENPGSRVGTAVRHRQGPGVSCAAWETHDTAALVGGRG
jgi:hypothetical protein